MWRYHLDKESEAVFKRKKEATKTVFQEGPDVGAASWPWNRFAACGGQSGSGGRTQVLPGFTILHP